MGPLRKIIGIPAQVCFDDQSAAIAMLMTILTCTQDFTLIQLSVGSAFYTEIIEDRRLLSTGELCTSSAQHLIAVLPLQFLNHSAHMLG